MQNISFRVATACDESIVLEIFKQSATYFEHIEGTAPTIDIVRNEMQHKPQKVLHNYKKEFLILLLEDVPIGTVELHLHHPQNGIAYIGLFLLIQSVQKNGLGTSFYHRVESYCNQEHGIHSIRLGISDDQDVTPFWRKLGFTTNGHSYNFQGVHRITHTIEYEKCIRMPYQIST